MIEGIRERHRRGAVCVECEQAWPCGAVRLLDVCARQALELERADITNGDSLGRIIQMGRIIEAADQLAESASAVCEDASLGPEANRAVTGEGEPLMDVRSSLIENSQAALERYRKERG